MDSENIFEAVKTGNLQFLKQAIQKGVERNLQDERGNSLLMIATTSEQILLAEYLITLKADMYIYNKEDETVFQLAEKLENRIIYNLLIDNCLKPEEVIYLIGHHCKPREVQEDDIIGAYINCYIVSNNYETAYERCKEMIDVDGWDILEVEDELIIDWSSIPADDDDREFIEQAIIDKEVMLIYSYGDEDEL